MSESTMENETSKLLAYPNPSIMISSLSSSLHKWQSDKPLFLENHYLLPLLFLSYLLLVRTLRYRRAAQNLKGFPNRASFANMTLGQAAEIQIRLVELEFPFFFEKALQFALFRPFGIPSISSLLHQTKQLSASEFACKRFVDTEVLIKEFMSTTWGEERWADGVARMNALHAPFIKAGKIKNDDMIYTLSLFGSEPIRWAADWEWREFSDVEKCAMGVFWKGMGDAMGIEYKGLPGYESGKGWQDGLEWLEEIIEWSLRYEEKEMVPAKSNWFVAEQTTQILLWPVPSWGKAWGKKAVYVLMDDRLRKAMIYPPPPPFLTKLVHAILYLRAFLLRHLAVPRPSFLRFHNITDTPSADGTYHMTSYDAMPYYVRPTIWNRWNPGAWMSWTMGLPIPGDEGTRFYPDGYKVSEVGPEKAAKGFGSNREKVEKMRRVGCPFAVEGNVKE